MNSAFSRSTAAVLAAALVTTLPVAVPAKPAAAVLAVGALHAFGRRRMLFAGVGVLVCVIALSYASQLLTLTAFYA